MTGIYQAYKNFWGFQMCSVSTSDHQQIGVILLPIICFTPQLLVIIAKYLLLLLLFVCIFFAIICYYCTRSHHPTQNVNYCKYSNTIIAIIDSYYQLFALMQVMELFCILGNYWINFERPINCIIAIDHNFPLAWNGRQSLQIIANSWS